MSEKDNTGGVSLEVRPDGAAVHVSEGTLSSFGKAAGWLFPRKAAKVKITAALAERVADKIKEGSPLDDLERGFVGQVFAREARALANTESAAERVHQLLPEVQARLPPLPAAAEAAGHRETFVSRAQGVAAEISEEDIRTLFARVVAGEVCRPGAFSLRTLELVRTIDPRTAEFFQRICNYVIDDYVVRTGAAALFLMKEDFDNRVMSDLQDLGLLVDAITAHVDDGQVAEWAYGDRIIRLQHDKSADGFWMPGLRLTRTGRELASVLPFDPSDEYFQAVLQSFRGSLRKRGTIEWRRGDSAWVDDEG